jgi:hypothetical protein
MPKTPSLSQLMEPPDTPGGFSLVAGPQAVVVVGEPAQECGGLFDLVAGEVSAGRSDRLVPGAGSQSGQDFPGREALDELAMVAVTDRVEVGEEPAFEQADLLVDAGQDTAGHQQLAYVGGRPPGLQGVKRLVG